MSNIATRQLFALGLGALVLAGCGGPSDATPGKRVVLHSTVLGREAASMTFTTGFGWDVTLTKALVSTSGLYYFDGPPPTAMRTPTRGLKERVFGLVLGTAWAHPGHYQAGTALGQVLLDAPLALDVFAETPTTLPDGDGVTGTYRSARFVLPQVAPPIPALGGHLAVAEGSATKHGEQQAEAIHFRLVADSADVAKSVKDGAVDGCVFDEAVVSDDGTVTLEIRPSIWLNLVDFSKLARGSAESPAEAHDAGFSQGVTQLSAYRFSYSQK